MRQIGVRDEAGMKGGCGDCGRTYCCSSFLKAFDPISVRMAKDQNLSLNPVKLSGGCGRAQVLPSLRAFPLRVGEEETARVQEESRRAATAARPSCVRTCSRKR